MPVNDLAHAQIRFATYYATILSNADDLFCDGQATSACSKLFTEETTLGNMGAAYQDLAEYNKAIECYHQQQVIAEEIGDRRGLANALMNMGNVYQYFGEASKALKHYEKALIVFRRLKDRRGEGQVEGNM